FRPGSPVVRRARADVRWIVDRGATHRLRQRRPGELGAVMRRRPARLPALLLLAAAAGAAGCGGEDGSGGASGSARSSGSAGAAPSADDAVEVVDAAGRTVALARPARRI